MLKLRSKPCQIGSSINTRTQRNGEEREPYLDIPVSLSITAKELNLILAEPKAADAWFATTDGKLDEPLMKHLAPYKLKAKFENSKAVLVVGLHSTEIDCGDVTLNKLVFEPTSDGRTTLSLKIQCAATKKTIEAILWLDKSADVQLQFGEMTGDEAQEELSLEVEDADDASLSRHGADEELSPSLN